MRPSALHRGEPSRRFRRHLVLDDFRPLDRAWREMEEEQTERETIIRDLMRCELRSPVGVVAFNTAEG
jgi:hypothetical protein